MAVKTETENLRVTCHCHVLRVQCWLDARKDGQLSRFLMQTFNNKQQKQTTDNKNVLQQSAIRLDFSTEWYGMV